jgi:membrane protein YqaA with SNARE-associated domain
MKNFFAGLLHFIFRIGYFGPLVTGILDSSFLSVPFGNDLVVVGLVARNHAGAPWYVLMAACGSTIGALLNALVSRKLGEEGIKRVAGAKRYESLRSRIGNRAGPAIAFAGVAPPPFPFNAVIAAAAGVGYPIWRILIINFFARTVRFAILAVLAIRFGHTVLSVARSQPFEWAMMIFISLCVIASIYSVWRWWRKTRRQTKQTPQDSSA